MAAFFIPGIANDIHSIENAYDAMRRQIALELGRLPRAQRIFKLWTRRGSLDCITEVGKRDPVRGGTVIAIFDMGPHQPFVVCREQALGSREATREVLGCSAYSVWEFDG